MNTRVLAEINNVAIEAIEKDSETFIPIRPICKAIGVDAKGQRQKLKEDEILSTVVALVYCAGANGKMYKMTCLPLKYIFGWLFTICPRRVGTHTQKLIVEHKKQCYDLCFKALIEKRNINTKIQNKTL